MKRTSPAEFDDNSQGGRSDSPASGGAKRRRWVIFEPVRLPAVDTVVRLHHSQTESVRVFISLFQFLVRP